MMKRILYGCAAGAALLLASPSFAAGTEPKRITVLYDAFGPPSALQKDWGFAALVEYGGRRILFDTGNNAKIFEPNVKGLGINLKKLDAAVISRPFWSMMCPSRTSQTCEVDTIPLTGPKAPA